MDTFTRGGTNAGHRSPFNGRALPWKCGCLVEVLKDGEPLDPPEAVQKTNLGALAKCPDCRQERPAK
jgi:hypothetical protein